MVSKNKQRLFGVILLLVGVGFTLGAWYEAITLSHYAKFSAVAFPVLAFFGLTLVVSPIDKNMLQEKFGIDSPTSMEHYTVLQKVLLYSGAAAAVVNYVGLRGVASGWF